MTGLDWTRARRWERKPRPVGAVTDRQRRYLAAQQARLKRESAARRAQRS